MSTQTYTETTYRTWTIRHEHMGHVNIITPDGLWAGGHPTAADAKCRIDTLIERASTASIPVPYKGRTAYMTVRIAPTDTGSLHGPDTAATLRLAA
jgi:hypothetical protein